MQQSASKVNEQTFLDRWRIDPVLLLALFVALAFCLYGIRWGRVEDWNPDEMALRQMSLTLKPHGYEKPPFHTFVNHLLVLWPLSVAEFGATKLTGRWQNFNELKLLGSRLVTAAMFLGMVLIGYKITDAFCGRGAARMVALVFATSAEFFVQTHFLTADIPVVFWMMLAMFLRRESFSIRRRRTTYSRDSAPAWRRQRSTTVSRSDWRSWSRMFFPGRGAGALFCRTAECGSASPWCPPDSFLEIPTRFSIGKISARTSPTITWSRRATVVKPVSASENSRKEFSTSWVCPAEF